MYFSSSIESMYFLLPIIGFIIGLGGSMLGGGGGFIFLPILTLIFKVPPHVAVTTSLVATLPICIVGSLRHFQKGNIHVKVSITFALIGIVGALFGTYITDLISSRVLNLSFGVYSILIALNIGYLAFKDSEQIDSSNENLSKQTSIFGKFKITFFGFTAGLITGALGTSAAALVLAGLMTLRIPLKMVIGTSLIIVLSNTLFAVCAHFLVSEIDMTLVYFLTSGSVLGAFIGPHLLMKANITKSNRLVKYTYAGAIAILGIIMITK